MISLYAAIGFASLLLILASKSHKIMNLVSAAHPLAYLLLTAYILSSATLPAYFFADEYFFIDHLGIFEVLITSILFFLAAIYSKGYIEGSIRLKEMNAENLKL